MNKTSSPSAPIALVLLASWVLAPALGAAPTAAPIQTPVPAAATLAPDEIAARGSDTLLSFDELDAVILLRHARSETGKSALRHLLEAGLLRVLGQENGVVITDEQVERRWKELDDEIRASGQSTGLAGYLAQSKVDLDEFNEHLRLSLIHETLARRGLGIPESRPISAEQLQNWLNAALLERNLTRLPAPWEDGIVAQCAGDRKSVV